MVLSLGRGFVPAMFLELMAHWLMQRLRRGSRPEELGGRRALSSEGKALQMLRERQEGALNDWRHRSLQVTARARVETGSSEELGETGKGNTPQQENKDAGSLQHHGVLCVEQTWGRGGPERLPTRLSPSVTLPLEEQPVGSGLRDAPGEHEPRPRRARGQAETPGAGEAGGGGECPPRFRSQEARRRAGMFPGTSCVQHGGCRGHALAAGWSTQQAGETWKTLAGGLGTWRRPWAQTDTVAEDGGVGCPEWSLGAGPQRRNADTGAGAAKGEKPKKTSARKSEGKTEGKRKQGTGRAGSLRSPWEASEKEAPGPTGQAPQGCRHSATGRLRSAVFLEINTVRAKATCRLEQGWGSCSWVFRA